MAGPEAKVEEYLVELVEAAGGECQKLDSRGRRGRCDRVVVFPRGGTYFVELKSAAGVRSDAQKREHARLIGRGFSVWLLSSKEAVEDFMRWAK